MPPDPGNHENPRFSSILKGFGGFWGHQEHQGVHGDISREYGPKPWSGDPVQLDFGVFRTFFFAAETGPEGSGRLRAAPGRLLKQKMQTALAKIKHFGVNIDFS